MEILEHLLLGPRSGRGGSIGVVRFELGEAEAVEVFDIYDVALVIPARGALDGGGEIPNGLPAELFAGFVNGKGKGSGFVRGGWVRGIGPFAGPVLEKIFHEFAHGTLGFRRRAEVKGFGKGSILAQTRAEPKVAGQTIEHVLPRTRGGGTAHGDGLAGYERADAVGHDSVDAIIAATDDVAGAGGGDAATEGALPTAGHYFSSGFARGINVVSAERVGLGEGVCDTVILIALVAGDDDDGAIDFVCSQCFQNVGGAEDISGGGFQRGIVRAAH